MDKFPRKNSGHAGRLLDPANNELPATMQAKYLSFAMIIVAAILNPIFSEQPIMVKRGQEWSMRKK